MVNLQKLCLTNYTLYSTYYMHTYITHGICITYRHHNSRSDVIGELKIKIIKEILINRGQFHSISNMAKNNSFTCIHTTIVNKTKDHGGFCRSEYSYSTLQKKLCSTFANGSRHFANSS